MQVLRDLDLFCVPACRVHRSLCWILDGCHEFGILVTGAHGVLSELEVPLLPIRLVTTQDWWLSQLGVQDVRLRLRDGSRCSCP